MTFELVVRPGKKPILVRRDPYGHPLMAIRARELGPKGEKTELYRLADLDASSVMDTTLATDGRILLVNVMRKSGPRALLYDGLTGKPIPLDPTALPPNYGYGRLTDTGAALALDERIGDKLRRQVFRLPDLRRLGTHPGGVGRIDDVVLLSSLPSSPFGKSTRPRGRMCRPRARRPLLR
jgi:hypothetical protein